MPRALLDWHESEAPSLLGIGLALTLAQHLAGLWTPLWRSLSIVTRAALTCDAAHGGAWGFARVLRLEHPALRTLSADLWRGALNVVTSTVCAPCLLYTSPSPRDS